MTARIKYKLHGKLEFLEMNNFKLNAVRFDSKIKRY